MDNISKTAAAELSELCPGNVDLQLAKEKGIIDAADDIAAYLDMEHKYLSLLNAYLTKNTGLNRYQRLLDNSELNFPAEEKDIYLERGAFGRTNIAIRNRAFIERLSGEDVRFLRELPDTDPIEYTEELALFVSRTWRELITVVLEEGETEPYPIVYDDKAVNKIHAMSDSLVFELYYELEYRDGKLTKDTAEKYEKALEIAGQMETELGNEIGHTVTVLIKVR